MGQTDLSHRFWSDHLSCSKPHGRKILCTLRYRSAKTKYIPLNTPWWVPAFFAAVICASRGCMSPNAVSPMCSFLQCTDRPVHCSKVRSHSAPFNKSTIKVLLYLEKFGLPTLKTHKLATKFLKIGVHFVKLHKCYFKTCNFFQNATVEIHRLDQ